jgi:hypothetical protein
MRGCLMDDEVQIIGNDAVLSSSKYYTEFAEGAE